MTTKTVTHHGITFTRTRIEKFCLKNGIKKLSLFGSVLRNDFGPESDIDILVEFMPGKVVTFFTLFDMEEELSSIFGGRKVELRNPQDLSRYFRDRVIAEAEVYFDINLDIVWDTVNIHIPELIQQLEDIL